jgi:endo-1,4-beta-xylanase
MCLDRRNVTKAGILALLGVAARNGIHSVAWAQPTPTGLASLGARCGMKVGIQSSTGRFTQSVLGPFLQANFNMITPPLKWANLLPNVDQYDFVAADHEFAYAKEHGLAVHGHNLCWNSSNPAWFDSALTKQNAREYLRSYITTVVGRYRGQVDSWDVVNEPIAVWNKQPDGLRAGAWLQFIGPEYIDLAFHATQAADPSSLRTLNLNGCEEQSSSSVDQVRAASLNLVKTLLKRGVPLQAVALEAHIDGPWRPRDSAYLNFIRALRDTGVQVYISEFDVNDSAIPGTEAQVKAAVAETYRNYLTDVLSVASLRRLIFWSMSDRFDWYGLLAATQARWQRPDGQSHRLGLTDENFAPNPAYGSLCKALANYSRARGER